MEQLCQNCHAPLPANAPRGLCPACLMKVALSTGSGTGAGAKPGFTPPPVGELAGKFPQLEILELIGQGGMGAVYKARQKELDRLVALKILPPGIGEDASFAERFTREARALARLNHPGIVTIHDSGRADGLYFFVMEFIDGVTLRELLALGRVSPREALAIVPQICDALQFAHDHGIVHRDIKPENILLNRRGQVKVADFGLAKIIQGKASSSLPATTSIEGVSAASSDPSDGNVLGTPAYMAPEQAKHPGEVDHRADIYALGVVLYQMLTGELPENRIEPPSQKVQIDVRLDEVVLRALEKKPELRYQQASEVKTVLQTIATSLSAASSLESRGRLDEPSAFKPPPGPVELKMKWIPGMRLVREEQLKQAMEIYNPGQPEPMKQDLWLDLRFSLTVSREPADTTAVELEFLSARMGMLIGSYQWQYDSTRSSPVETSQAAELFGKIVGSKLRYILNSANDIERVEGMDELMKRLSPGRGGVRPKAGMEWDKKEMDDLLQRLVHSQRPDHFAGIRQMFSKAFFKQLVRRSVYLASGPVQPGDSWPVADEYPTTFLRTLVREFNVSFAGWETRGKRMCARLEYQGTEKTKVEPDSSTLSKLMKPGTQGTVSGVAWFDPELGAVVETNTKRDFSVTMHKPVNPIAIGRAVAETQSTTDHHHQVLVDKLVTVEGP